LTAGEEEDPDRWVPAISGKRKEKVKGKGGMRCCGLNGLLAYWAPGLAQLGYPSFFFFFLFSFITLSFWLQIDSN
jgi:hypothetical protein